MMKTINYLLWTMLLLCACVFAGCSDDDKEVNAASINVTGFMPVEGLPGTEVTINASGFGADAKVYFNDTEVSEYISRSNNAIVVRVPEDASTGRIGVLDGDAFGFSQQEFTFIPSAVIEGYSQDTAPVGETLMINGRNFSDVGIDNITVLFGQAEATVISASTTSLTVLIPEGAESGPVVVRFGDIQTVSGPQFTVGKVVVKVPDSVITLKDYVLGGGSFDIGSDGTMGSTKNGAYVVCEVTPEADGLYQVLLDASTNQNYNVYVNIDMGTDADALSEKPGDTSLSQKITKQGWSTFATHTYGAFKLNGGQKYYLRVLFLADGTSWVANIKNVTLHYADDQEQESINVGGSDGKDYNLYSCDFNNNQLLPFLSTAVGTNYIKCVDNYAEFHYDAELYAQHQGERAYKGAEMRSDNYKSHSEGWYGFKLYLPSSGLSKDAAGTIITQIFNNGYGNTWAGHMHIDGEQLVMSYRSSSAASAEIQKTVCKLEWDKWMDVVIYFRAGRSNKGAIKIWVGDAIQESKPTLSLENIDFGFSTNWTDDTTMDDSYFSCKFGLYVADTYSRTIRMDNVSALDANPSGAFGIVKP